MKFQYIAPTKKVEELIAQSIKILDKIKEETDSQNCATPRVEASPKIKINLVNTWGNDAIQQNDTWRELANDLDTLELHYKLRENWLEIEENVKKPFTADVSIIKTEDKP